MKNKKTLLSVLKGISLLILLVGFLFTIMHWPYGYELKITGLFSIIIVETLRFFNLKEKTFIDYIEVVFFFCIAILLILNILGIRFTPFDTIVLKILLPLYAVFYLIRNSVLYFKKDVELERKSNLERISYTVFYMAGTLIIVGVIFKLLHFPGGSIILSVGILLAVIWLILVIILKLKPREI